LAFPQLDVEGIIGRDQMKGSKLIRSFVTEARAEARAETLREAVAEALRINFGAEAVSGVLPLIERIEDAQRLRELHALAIRCASPDEFRAGLGRANPGR
jgi:hypothetical protein